MRRSRSFFGNQVAAHRLNSDDCFVRCQSPISKPAPLRSVNVKFTRPRPLPNQLSAAVAVASVSVIDALTPVFLLIGSLSIGSSSPVPPRAFYGSVQRRRPLPTRCLSQLPSRRHVPHSADGDLSRRCPPSYTPPLVGDYLRQSLTSACLLTSILRALFCEVARPKVNCIFYLQNGRQHGYEDVTIQHPRTSKNTNLLLNVPYILPHIHSYSPRAPPWPSPSPPACCGLVLLVNQCVVASPA